MMNLDKTKKYVVACSFGPDSMYLVNFCLEKKLDFVVAHVNYHRRPESNSEEEKLREYCQNNNLIIEVLDTSDLKPSGNFQKWARNIRYKFFSDVANKYCCSAVLVAHNEDDLIETYLMQKEKNNFVSHYGIAEKTIINNVEIIRPLLNLKKSFITKQNIYNKIPFSIDSSNLENHYRRNQIRHSIVEKMNDAQRKNILSEIKALNNSLNIGDLHSNIWELQYFLGKNNKELVLEISSFLQENKEFKVIEIKEIENIKKSFSSSKSNIQIRINKNISIWKSYDCVYLMKNDLYKSFEYKVDRPQKCSFKFVDIDFRNGSEDRNIYSYDYPITIKSLNGNENYQIKNYFSKVKRLFIDWKMPGFLRCWWPGVFNRKGDLVYIPRYRAKYIDNHKSKFVIKFPSK